MPNLSRYPTPIQMEFVTPHVKRGDYYLVMNPHTGRRTWVYPRKMGEDRYAVVSSLGTDAVAAGSGAPIDIQGWINSMSALNPTTLANELNTARADLARAQTLTKIAIGASIVASALTLILFLRGQ
jgi:hypothetical protein